MGTEEQCELIGIVKVIVIQVTRKTDQCEQRESETERYNENLTKEKTTFITKCYL